MTPEQKNLFAAFSANVKARREMDYLVLRRHTIDEEAAVKQAVAETDAAYEAAIKAVREA